MLHKEKIIVNGLTGAGWQYLTQVRVVLDGEYNWNVYTVCLPKNDDNITRGYTVGYSTDVIICKRDKFTVEINYDQFMRLNPHIVNILDKD